MLIFFLILSLIFAPAMAGDRVDLSLKRALEMASQRHVSVLMSSERVKQALARQTLARSSLLPTVQGQASEYRQIRNLESQGIEFPGRDPVVGPFNSFDAR